jgi:hypothetical protein
MMATACVRWLDPSCLFAPPSKILISAKFQNIILEFLFTFNTCFGTIPNSKIMTPSLTTKVQSCGCKRQEKQRKRQRTSFLLTLLVVILPKCPFCVFGYSSVLVMCSGAKIHTYEANQLAYLPICLATAVLISLFWNFRGQKTWLAIGIGMLGMLPLVYAQLISGNQLEYFAGTGLILLAVLLNGRLYHRFFKSQISTLT